MRVKVPAGSAVTVVFGEDVYLDELLSGVAGRRVESVGVGGPTVLENPPPRRCVRCGHPEDRHPFRHPFVAAGS